MCKFTCERPLTIMAFNANGIAGQSNELEILLYERNIDILLINETHLKEKDKFRLQNYHIYTSFIHRHRVDQHLPDHLEIQGRAVHQLRRPPADTAWVPGPAAEGGRLWLHRRRRWPRLTDSWPTTTARHTCDLTIYKPNGSSLGELLVKFKFASS